MSLEQEHSDMIDKLFWIPNLAFLKYIKYPVTKESVRIHNNISKERDLPKIDFDKLEYVEVGDPRWNEI